LYTVGVHGWWGSGTRYNEGANSVELLQRNPFTVYTTLKEKLPQKTLRRLVVLVWVYRQFEFWGAAVQNFSEEPKGFRDSHRYTVVLRD